ncbi:hypothetical protein HI914_06720 [Erysiphe necator]|nr:hypothetical protein HI914_06720 [Erysiphe necator]
MSDHYQQLLRKLCRERGWAQPIFSIRSDPPGHVCTVRVCGYSYTGIADLVPYGAKERAAAIAYENVRHLIIPWI